MSLTNCNHFFLKIFHTIKTTAMSAPNSLAIFCEMPTLFGGHDADTNLYFQKLPAI